VLQAVTCAEAARASSTLRHRVEHAELLDDALISRVAGQKLVLGMQPAFEAFWGGHERMYARRLGSRWQRTNRFRSLLDSGVVIAGGSDAPITPVDPVAGIAAAVNHPNPAERIQPAQALAMFSSAAAFALRIEGEAGEVCEGRPADLTILDQDPRSVPAARVLATYRAGRLIFGDPAA
jgi:predicted amidohydrolase YtcJ